MLYYGGNAMTRIKRKAFASILLIIFSAISNLFVSKATGDATTYIDKLETQMQRDVTGNKDANDATFSLLSSVATVVKVVAVGIAIIMLIVIAMKYMLAAPGEKAEIKKSAVVYIIGAVVLFAVSGILAIIQKFSTIVT